MLVDSSVWIAYLRGDNLIEVDLLVEALERGAPVWIAPPILQEVLQGADSADRFARWDRVLGELPMVIAPRARGGLGKASIVKSAGFWGLDGVSLSYMMTVKYMPKAETIKQKDGEPTVLVKLGW